VRVVLDAIGSSGMKWSAAAGRLTDAGCRLDYYQPLKWYRLHRANNRTHRELLIVDGRVAFVGGAGVADWWYEASAPEDPAWRDTMVLTAMTWSASVAWSIPSKNPTTTIGNLTIPSGAVGARFTPASKASSETHSRQVSRQ
jgi:hypothetical protein